MISGVVNHLPQCKNPPKERVFAETQILRENIVAFFTKTGSLRGLFTGQLTGGVRA
jgi:hypothetical protein